MILQVETRMTVMPENNIMKKIYGNCWEAVISLTKNNDSQIYFL